MLENDTWRVKDLYLGAFIYSQGKELITIERENGTCWFVFANKKSCEELASLYWSRKARLDDAKSLSDSIRSLKDLIYSQ